MEGKPLRQSDLFEGLSIITLKFSGLWYHMNVYRTTGRKGLLITIQIFGSYLIIIPYVMFQIMYVIVADVNMQKAALTYFVIAPILDLSCKMFFFWYNIGEICAIYDGLRRDFLKSIPLFKDLRSSEIYKLTAKRCNRMLMAYYASLVVTMIPYVTVPGYEIEETGSDRKKVLSGWYPFPYSESPWYEIVYAYEGLIVAGYAGSNYFLYQCAILIPLICICAHFDVLNYHIATLRKQDKTDSEMNKELKEILKDYEKLIRYGDSLKAVYSVIITVLLAGGILNVTTITLHLIFEGKDPVFIIKNGGLFCFQSIELILICLCSSMMEKSSSNIHEALYSNDWYLADKNFALTQQMMMIRASRPLTLTAAKMYPVNLEMLLNIYQFIYSTAALLSKAK